jgi:hypothetical protein
MAERITYYALIWPGHEEATGIARRREDDKGFATRLYGTRLYGRI